MRTIPTICQFFMICLKEDIMENRISRFFPMQETCFLLTHSFSPIISAVGIKEKESLPPPYMLSRALKQIVYSYYFKILANQITLSLNILAEAEQSTFFMFYAIPPKRMI